MSETVQTAPPLVTGKATHERRRRVAARPTAREWVRHAAFLLLTALTATWAGLMLSVPADALVEPEIAAPATVSDYVSFIFVYYAQALSAYHAYALAHPQVIWQGATFACALLSILLAHEAGHYVACRLYGVDATLPFFLPAPPLFLAGTFGAFIKIKSPIPSRRALFDIGVAGPLAGFVVIIPVAVAALLTAEPNTAPLPAEGVIVFNDPLLLRLLAKVLAVEDLSGIAPNPFYFAAWIGLLVTSLNLLPVGQLDGGHAVYSLFGARLHRLVGIAAFTMMVVLAPLGWLWHGAPSGVVYVLLLAVMLRMRHPEAEDESDRLGRGRLAVAVLTLVVFLLSFQPFPVTLI
ncbi:MAG TPA: site-2 protease family protein [Pyrinomonadaceae bacterium]|nr:site-2 protease family protein [Pyrinomonadaceae bacterium]